MASIERTLAFDERVRFRVPEAVARWAVAGSVGALIAVGALVFSRRVAGALTAGLPALPLVVMVVVVGVVVLGGRLVWRRVARSGKPQEAGVERLIGRGGSAAVVLLALGCSLGRGVDWVLWLPLVALDQWQLRWFLHGGRRLNGAVGKTGIANPGFMDVIDDRVLQQLVRVREADGHEAIHGTLRADFVAGQRQATLHVGFCPPLERSPVVEAEAGEGPDAEVKVSQAFAHGARLEVRLATAALEDCSVVVEVSAKPQATG